MRETRKARAGGGGKGGELETRNRTYDEGVLGQCEQDEELEPVEALVHLHPLLLNPVLERVVRDPADEKKKWTEDRDA